MVIAPEEPQLVRIYRNVQSELVHPNNAAVRIPSRAV